MVKATDCRFGYLLDGTLTAFSSPDYWEVNHQDKNVKLLGRSLEERNEQIHETLVAEREKGTFKLLKGWAGEVFAMYGPSKELVVSIEQVAATLFGINTYGVQMLAYQENLEGISIWIARRAKTKRTYPSMLDSTVGGQSADR